jgi:hypothetical protein
VQVEDQSAEVAVGELACFAQEARSAAHAPAGPEAGRSGLLDGVRWLALVRRLDLVGHLS